MTSQARTPKRALKALTFNKPPSLGPTAAASVIAAAIVLFSVAGIGAALSETTDSKITQSVARSWNFC